MNTRTGLLGLIFLSFNLFAQPHLLWEVNKSGQFFWIAGVVHTVTDEFYATTETIEYLYNNSTTIVPESIWYDSQKLPVLRPRYKSKPSEAAVKITTSLVNDGLLSTSTASLLLEKPIEELQDHFDKALYELNPKAKIINFKEGYDAQLTRRAIRENKPVDTLEYRWRKYEVWSRLCANESDRDGILEALNELLREKRNFDSISNENLVAIQNGDLELATEINIRWNRLNRFGIYHQDCSIRPRSAEWLTVLPSLLKRHKKPLLIVGAGHVIGKDSFIDLLKKDGYEVKRFRLIDHMSVNKNEASKK